MFNFERITVQLTEKKRVLVCSDGYTIETIRIYQYAPGSWDSGSVFPFIQGTHVYFEKKILFLISHCIFFEGCFPIILFLENLIRKD